jgi:hypothetical protein
MYIGYGIKTGDVCFNPTSPQDILNDPEEPIEQPEPTPLQAPPVIQQQEQPNPEGEGDNNGDEAD